MTKKEIRVAILGQLALGSSQIIWDIGAGTGSVSIEIGRLCPSSQIYAIEKTAMGITLIEKNCEHLQVSNVIPIYGKAPQILENLPSPHRVFIGGSSGNLETILDICQDKLEPEGTIVIALATLEHQAICLQWLKLHRWDYRVTQIQITRSLPVGQYTRLSPLNPVTLVSASKYD
jgi:precorrin-6Y C5,15-methyltransferase (decarboxylating)